MTRSSRPTVFLHIGTPKSGTTYLQDVLHRNRDALLLDGVLVPRTSHYHAALDLRQLRMAGYEDPRTAGAWQRLVAEIRACDQTAIVSHELLAGARPELAAKALRDLSFADVHIVLTVRNMAKTLPAAWQERVKLGGNETLSAFISSVRQSPPAGGKQWTDAAHKFWNLQNVPAVLTKWSRGIDPCNVHVIAVPPASESGGADLWHRFADVIGVDPRENHYAISAARVNRSLGAVETELLRRFNDELGDYPWEVYAPLVKQHLAGALGARAGRAIRLADDDFAWAREWSSRTARTVEARGYHALGVREELTVATQRPGADPEVAASQDLLAVAVEGMVTLANYVAADSETHTRQTLAVFRTQLRRSRGAIMPEIRQALSDLPAREVLRRGLTMLSARVRGHLRRRVTGTRHR